jgi:uracil-DNA glycosylase family 4
MLAPNPKCQLCELHKTTSHVCVPGTGSPKAKVMAIGEIPVFGRGGQLLQEELSNAGIGNVFTTQIVRCRPPDNRPPKPDEIKACRPYLDYELNQIKPRFVLTLGSPATKAVLKEAKITLAHGKLIDMPNWTGIAAYHPNYIIRDPSKLPEFQADLRRLAGAIQGVKIDNRVAWDVVNKDTLEEFIEQFIAAEEFSFDCETGGLFQFHPENHPDNYIACVGIGLKEQSWVIPCSVRGSPFRSREAQRKLFQLLAKLAKGKTGIAQNGKFDNQWIYQQYRVTFPLSFDIMLAHHLLDENAPHDLEFLARTELDAPSYDVDLATKQGKKNLMVMMEYNAKDTNYTFRIKANLEKRLKKDPSLWKIFKKLVMPASRALFKVERNGLYVNLDKMDLASVENAKELNQTLARLNQLVGHNVNWNSPQQVAMVLFEELGLPVIETTKTGKPATGEATLVALKDEHVVADLLVKYRELEKFRGTYLEGWRELMNGPHLHFSYKLHGTVTGRFSSRLHQTPRNGTIRNIITAPLGWTFMQGDFSQAELNIVAQTSQDPEMMRCFREGIDLHWRTLMYVILAGGAGEYIQPLMDTALKLTNSDKKISLQTAANIVEKAGHERCIELWKGWKEARKKAKGIGFGYVFGMYEKKFIEYAKLNYGFEPTYDEAHSIREAYFRLYRGLKPWHDRQKKLAHLNGEVRNLIGRIRRLPTVKSPDRSLMMEAERQSINAPIQGFIGDLKAMALVELVQTLDPDVCKVVGEVHDSILFWIRTDQLQSELDGQPQILSTILKVMESPRIMKELGVVLEIPVKCELEYGDWGKGTAISREKLIRK